MTMHEQEYLAEIQYIRSLRNRVGIVSETDAAVMLGVAEKTLQRWRLRGLGPQHVKLSRRVVLYHLSAIQAWLEGDQRFREVLADEEPDEGDQGVLRGVGWELEPRTGDTEQTVGVGADGVRQALGHGTVRGQN